MRLSEGQSDLGPMTHKETCRTSGSETHEESTIASHGLDPFSSLHSSSSPASYRGLSLGLAKCISWDLP